MSALAVPELLFDSAGDGLQGDVTLTNSPPIEAGQFVNFQSRGLRSVPGHRAQLGAGILDEPQGSVFLWCAPDTAHDDAARPAFGNLFGWGDDGDNRIQLFHDKAAAAFTLLRRAAGLEAGAVVNDGSFAGGAALRVYGSWTADRVEVALNGGAIQVVANAHIPTLAATLLDVGSNGFGSGHFEGAFAAVAFFARPLTPAELAYFAALERPPLLGELVGRSMVGLWVGEEPAYYDSALDLLTPDAFEVAHARGRDGASTRGNRSTAGSLTASLRNADGRYSPANAASPLAGMLHPGRLVRLRLATITRHHTRWTGYLQASPQVQSAGSDHHAVIEAYGPLAVLGATAVDVLPEAAIGSGAAIEAALDAAGWPAGARVIAVGRAELPTWYVSGQDALSAIQDIEDTEGPGAFLREGADGAVIFEDRHHRLSGERLSSQATFAEGPGATNPVVAIRLEDPLADVFNRVVVTSPGYSDPGSPEVVWTWSGGDIFLRGNAEALTVVARWPQGDASAEGAFIDSWVTPDATDVQLMGGLGVSFSDLSVTTVATSNTLAITIQNNATNAIITGLRARASLVTRLDAGEVVAEDAASQALYGVRDWPLSPRWLFGFEEASLYAHAELERRKQPVPVFTFEVAPRRSDAHMETCLDLDVSDRITVDVGHPAVAVEDEDVFIERIEEVIADGGTRHALRFGCSSADADSGWWVLGVALLGVDTRLTY